VKRAALYLRVSTLDQHPETQLYDLRQMASQRGWQIVEEYTDRVSGAKARRPGLDRLMSDARRGRFDVVLVWASDRLARSVKHFLEVLDELSRLNVEFISFRENLDTGGPRLHRHHLGHRRTGTQSDHRASARRHAASAAGRPAHRPQAAGA
jgi:DNA invertase Pin-like site-specific DNA recombinase